MSVRLDTIFRITYVISAILIIVSLAEIMYFNNQYAPLVAVVFIVSAITVFLEYLIFRYLAPP